MATLSMVAPHNPVRRMSIPQPWTLTVGGVRFTVTWPAGDQPDDFPDPGYDGFVNPDPAPPVWLEIAVSARAGVTPPPRTARCLFDGGESWSAWAVGKTRRLLRHRPPADLPPAWQAALDPTGDRVAIRYGRHLRHGVAGARRLRNPFSYPLDLALMIHLLAPRQGLILHGAGLAVSGGGYIFLGRSTAGKTTLMRLCAACPGVVRLSDDRLIVRRTAAGFTVHGGPWLGNPEIAANTGVPLRGIFLLTKAARHAITALAPGEAMDGLLPVASIPWYDTRWAPPCLDTCDALLRAVPARRLAFAPTPDLADFLMDRLTAGD